MSEIANIHDLFINELQDIYHAEKQLCKALPKMAKKASNPELRDGINEHLEETYRQCERLEQIFEELGMRAKAKPCEAMRGLIEEATEMMREEMPGEVMDVAIVSCSQKVEHYEIASYGTLVALAQAMGHDGIASMLQETLDEEKHTDEKLTELAESEINPTAMQAFGAESDEEVEQEDRANSGRRTRQQRERYAEMQAVAGRSQSGSQSASRQSQPTSRQQPSRPASRQSQPASRSRSQSAGQTGRTTARESERRSSNATTGSSSSSRRGRAEAAE